MLHNTYAGTYDVQSVRSRITGDSSGLELSCTFMRGSRAQSCRLTVCEELNGVAIEQSCTNVSIARRPNQQISTKTITNFISGSGTYMITEVVEIESDGVVTVLTHAADVKTIPYWQPTTVHTTTMNSSK